MTSTISEMIRPSLFRGSDVVVLFVDTFKEAHVNRLALEIKAVDLYPEGYNLNTLLSVIKKGNWIGTLKGDEKRRYARKKVCGFLKLELQSITDIKSL
ncbi:hypothetical protein [Peribacillus simplex]|uniref:hypothetical protein n=1 Tax=Peribacillus simplex TaxID=1478 RepID=UPI0024C0E172|nr:hypothetical protein [Peribacillus simplex]WHY96789.1 hypothetical protein QNH37_22905 [Peribacillus simplex]